MPIEGIICKYIQTYEYITDTFKNKHIQSKIICTAK